MFRDLPSIKDLIKAHENDEVEFKRAFRWNHYNGKVEKSMHRNITRVLSSFLNSNGGKLVIGVDDDGNILGIENDINSYNQNDYQKGKDLFLTDIGEKIRKNIGATANFNCKATFKSIEGHEILIISVTKSDSPYFHLKEEFYIRSQNATIKLSKEETFDYFKNRFSSTISKTNLEYIFFTILGYLRLFKNIILEKLEYYLSLLIILVVFYFFWYVNLFLDYSSSIRFFPFQFIVLALITLKLFIDLQKKRKNSNFEKKAKQNSFIKYIPEIKLWLVIMTLICFGLTFVLSFFSIIILLPLIKSNFWEMVMFVFQILMNIILYILTYREIKNFPKFQTRFLNIENENNDKFNKNE